MVIINDLLRFAVPAAVGFGFVESPDFMDAWEAVGKPFGVCWECGDSVVNWPRIHCRLCKGLIDYTGIAAEQWWPEKWF